MQFETTKIVNNKKFRKTSERLNDEILIDDIYVNYEKKSAKKLRKKSNQSKQSNQSK